MNIVERINKQIEKLKNDYSSLKAENDTLKRRLEVLEYENDEFFRNNQDLILKIDSTLTSIKGK